MYLVSCITCFKIAHILKDKHEVAGDINSLNLLVNPFKTTNPLTGTLANGEDPVEMLYFHQGLHYLERKKYNIFLKIIICDPSIHTMVHPDLTLSKFMGNSIDTQWVKRTG